MADRQGLGQTGWACFADVFTGWYVNFFNVL